MLFQKAAEDGPELFGQGSGLQAIDIDEYGFNLCVEAEDAIPLASYVVAECHGGLAEILDRQLDNRYIAVRQRRLEHAFDVHGRKSQPAISHELGIGDGRRRVEEVLESGVTEMKELRVVNDTGTIDVVETDFLDTGKRHKQIEPLITRIAPDIQ